VCLRIRAGGDLPKTPVLWPDPQCETRAEATDVVLTETDAMMTR
jgi:hypothetical protein